MSIFLNDWTEVNDTQNWISQTSTRSTANGAEFDDVGEYYLLRNNNIDLTGNFDIVFEFLINSNSQAGSDGYAFMLYDAFVIVNLCRCSIDRSHLAGVCTVCCRMLFFS